MIDQSSKKRKRILYCDSNVDGTLGGAYFSLFYLVEGLNKEEFEPIVIFYKHNPLIEAFKKAGIQTEILEPFQPVSFNFFNYNTFPFLRNSVKAFQSATNFLRYFVFQSIKFSLYIKRHKIDMVHLNNSVLRSHNWMLAAKIMRIKVVSHERGINNKFPLIASILTRRLDAVICISDAVRSNLEKHGFSDAKLVTVYNGLDPSRVKILKPIDEIKAQYHIPNNVPLIGIVGNIKEWKGQEVVIRATGLVKKQFPQIRCFIVGDTADSDRYYLKHLESVIKELGLTDNILFTGFQSNVSDFMNAMDIVIHASTSGEPFGRVLLEAMALEKPLIGARGGAVPEIIDHSLTGLMFEPGNPDDLADAIIKILQDPEKAGIMGKNGRERLVSKFHIQSNIVNTQKLYRSILGMNLQAHEERDQEI